MSWTAFRHRGETLRPAPKHRTTSDPATTASGSGDTPSGSGDTPSEASRPDRARREFVDRIKAALAA